MKVHEPVRASWPHMVTQALEGKLHHQHLSQNQTVFAAKVTDKSSDIRGHPTSPVRSEFAQRGVVAGVPKTLVPGQDPETCLGPLA